MLKSLDERIEELTNARDQQRELKRLLRDCQNASDMLLKKRRDLMHRPIVTIAIQDNLKGDDVYSENVAIRLREIPEDLTELLLKILDSEKRSYQTELKALEEKYNT